MLKRLQKVLLTIETALCLVLFSAMFFSVTWQVASRYLLGRPLTWPSELSVYCFIAMVYLGSFMATRHDTHVAFDLLHSRLPARARRLSRITTDLLIAGALLYTLPAAIAYIKQVGGVRSSALSIPWGWLLSAYVLGAALMAVTLVLQTLARLREPKRPQEGVR